MRTCLECQSATVCVKEVSQVSVKEVSQWVRQGLGRHAGATDGATVEEGVEVHDDVPGDCET